MESISSRKELRTTILARRDSLSPAERAQKSKAVAENLWQLDPFSRASLLFLYVNFRSEVETITLIHKCLAKGMRIGVPQTFWQEQKKLVPYEIYDPENDLRPGYRGILEPDPERAIVLDPREIEVVIMPGSVFDLKGGRLGYGGGYYDRFLANDAVHAVRIGIAFDIQVVPEIPLLPHDQLLDYLVTESRILAMKK